MITDSKHKSSIKKTSSKKVDKILQVKMEKETPNVSVITKTTTPKVVIQSEGISNNDNILQNKHLFLKLICFVIMCIILLMTFFLSLKTYNTVNELSDYIHLIVQP